MPVDPSIALQFRGIQPVNPLQNAAQVYGLLNLIEQNKQNAQLNPLRLKLLEAQIAETQAQGEQRKTSELKTLIDLKNARDREAIMKRAAEEASRPDEATALEAARQADARGESVNITARNQNLLNSLMLQLAPQQFITGQMRQGPGNQYGIATPGSQVFDRRTGQFTGPQVPFAERQQPAPVPRIVPDVNRPGQFNYEDMRNPGVALAPAPAPASADRQDPTAKATYAAGLKDLQRDEKDLALASQLETALKRWKELNANTSTGRVSGLRPGVAQPQFQELVQLQSYLAVNNFKPGQGQISNFERQLIKGAGPRVDNDQVTNDRIVDVQLGAVQNARERASFREWYLESNKKLLGADRLWNEYIDKNPRYIAGEKGAIVPNQSRMDWMEWFTAPRIKNDSEYDQLPDGSLFFGPDGKPRRK